LHHDEAKEVIIDVLGDIKFDGHFNKCFDGLKDSLQVELIRWVKDCDEKKVNPIQSKKKNVIGFVKKFGSNVRAVLTKEKEGYFIDLFLDKHKYYEQKMDSLGF